MYELRGKRLVGASLTASVQVQSATGAAREAALEAAHRAEEALHITKARAAEAAGATKDKAQRTAQQAVEQAEAAAAAARDKVQHASQLLHACNGSASNGLLVIISCTISKWSALPATMHAVKSATRLVCTHYLHASMLVPSVKAP